LTALGYECTSCENSESALEFLKKKSFDLMLADIFMPESGGIALLQEVIRIRPDIAVILVTSVVEIEIAVDALKHGAYDYIAKPFSLEEMSISVSRALEKRRLILENRNYQKTLEEQVASRTYELKKALAILEQTYRSTLVALSKALDSRDADPDGRSLRVTAYATRIAWQSGMNESEIRVVEQGVLLHDLGKIGIPDNLLKTKETLGPAEQLLLQRHPEIGFRILSKIEFLKGAAQLVLHHHELYDGSGYPLGLKGSEIDIGARIYAVAEALEEFTSDQEFEGGEKLEAAIRKIKNMSGSQLDPQIVGLFLEIPATEWMSIHAEIGSNAEDGVCWRNEAAKKDARANPSPAAE
jgi:response regulator RpfG family c-di-GMP phosphodiesterase